MQFPLGMGRPDKAGKGGQTLAVTIGAEGGINYDAVVKQGRNRDKVVAATHGAMVPKLDRLTDGVRSATGPARSPLAVACCVHREALHLCPPANTASDSATSRFACT